MTAALANSDVLGFSINRLFAHDERNIKQKVRTFGNDLNFYSPHNGNMANRRGVPKLGSSWFIREWMDYYGLKQARMMELTGWSKASTSQIYNGVQDYSPKIVREAALAMNLQEYELLMHPDDAMSLRKLRSTAEQIVQIAHDSEERNGTTG